MIMHYWIQTAPSHVTGHVPHPRSGHSAVVVAKSKVILFGGLADSSFRNDVVVYDIDNKRWFEPECKSGSHGLMCPVARAFHAAVSIDCQMFIFGGRSGSKRLGDLWVLDTNTWKWSEMDIHGNLPSARDFSAAALVGNRKIVLYGGWDGKKWLSDVYILDIVSLECKELSVAGMLPPPRCGHTATMVEKRLLVFGGRGGGGPIMGDLWALRGLIVEDNETPGWTQLKLPGQAPPPRCGHTLTSREHYLLLFGGHGTGGWLSRYDVYYNDCIILDRVSAQWTHLLVGNNPPPARAYHTMICVGSRLMLFGGFDGKSTFGDLWWLVPEVDLKAKGVDASPPKSLFESKDIGTDNSGAQQYQEGQKEESAMLKLQKEFKIPMVNSTSELQCQMEDKEFVELSSSRLTGGQISGTGQEIQHLRDHWRNSTPESLPFKELGPLLHDYKFMIASLAHDEVDCMLKPGFTLKSTYRFYHMKDASQLRMDDIPKLLDEYKHLLGD